MVQVQFQETDGMILFVLTTVIGGVILVALFIIRQTKLPIAITRFWRI
jgi:Flp pilus assembly protein protease CpaA